VKASGEEQPRNGCPSERRDPLVTELVKAESELERIEAQRTAAKARIATLRNEFAALDAAPRPIAPDALSEPAPRTPADKVTLFRLWDPDATIHPLDDARRQVARKALLSAIVDVRNWLEQGELASEKQ
jgi:hypothetical protein